MSDKQYSYIIGDKTYIQRPLVLGQINQLMAVIKGTIIPSELKPSSILFSLGNKIPSALAIVLLEENLIRDKSRKEISKYLMDRDLTPLAEDIEFAIDPDTAVKVIEDFFDCNPIVSLLERLSGMTEKLKVTVGTRSPALSSSSPEATSPGGTISSGASPSVSADPTSTTGLETFSSAKP